MLTLKTYQQNALAALRDFLRAARGKPVAEAFLEAPCVRERNVDAARPESYHAIFGDTPCVCLRVPTGGGKTLLAAHAVAIAGECTLDSDSPVALWLTPSDAIRTQTLEALNNAHHPYRQALAEHFGERVRVCDLESLHTVGPQEAGRACIVIVATIQSFNVRSTAIRNVYAFDESLQAQFADLPPNATEGLDRVAKEDLIEGGVLTEADIGRVKWSVANWLHLQKPVVIVDEAHNNRTDTFFKSLGRLNPGCIIELTATPVPGNNVLYHVGAAELKAEQMIKLPVVLAEHPDGWQSCLRDALLTRERLEIAAQKESDYLRPIVLIQAQPKGGEATVDVVRAHLIEELHIPENRIAVATGAQKELDGIDLFDPACPVRCVITVEALKEGWDCSFAYVLASLQSVNSAKDVEQLLGRVLRMPYAKTRTQEELNRAYAHIVAENFAEAAANLADRMVQNMGFERYEAASVLLPQEDLPLAGGQAVREPKLPDCAIQLDAAPDTQHWPAAVKQAVEIRATSQGATVLVRGDAAAEVRAQVETFIEQSVPTKARESVRAQFDAHRALLRALMAPAQLGVSFAPVPQLCLDLGGHLELVERETLADLGDWDLLDGKVQLANFTIHESINVFEVDVKGARVTYKHADAKQLHLDAVKGTASEQGMVRWLDLKTRRPWVPQRQLQAYLVKMLTYLIHERGYSLTALERAREPLAQAIGSELERLREVAMGKGFQASLFDMRVPKRADAGQFSFRYQSGQYPARNIYRGRYEFTKHFYPVIHDLREKTDAGRQSEEFACAQALDAHPKVKHWVRNIERQEKFSFWLPTSSDYFYPDFVAELTDGRLLAVEYKGEPYKTNDDSREKKQVGDQWEKSSGGRCLFLFAVAEDEDGRTVQRQIADEIG